MLCYACSGLHCSGLFVQFHKSWCLLTSYSLFF
uniref:Translocating chain-associated membrane protein 1 n=1 Tax=Triatoma infestans TaxID=30076 RepID=A0A161M9Z5_TRIIF